MSDGTSTVVGEPLTLSVVTMTYHSSRSKDFHELVNVADDWTIPVTRWEGETIVFEITRLGKMSLEVSYEWISEPSRIAC